MKKILAAMLCAMLCCAAACAMAAGIAKVDAERLLTGLEQIPGLVEGENVTVKRKDGELTIHIQSNKVDWKQVLTYAYDAGSGYVSLFPGFANPGTVNGKAVAYQLGFGTNASTPDSEVLDFLEKDEQLADGDYNKARDSFFNGWEIGRYAESERLFVPMEQMDGGLVCRWYDENGHELLTERAKVTIKMTDKRTMNVGLDTVDSARITAHPADAIRDKLQISIEDGAARVQTDDVAALEQNSVEFRIAPPAGMDAKKLGVRCRQYAHNDMHEDDSFERRGYLSLDVPMPGTEPYTIEWFDRDTGETKRVERVAFTMVSLAERPWPGYSYEGYPALSPVPAANLTVNDTTREELGKQLGIRVTYGEKGPGILHFAPTESVLEKSAALSECFFRYSVKAPKGAAYYSENHSSSSDIFGEDIGYMEEQHICLSDPQERKAVPQSGVVECRSGYMPVREHKGDGDTRVFMPTEMTGEFAGGVTLLYWYDKDGKFLSAEYFVERQDPFVVTYRERELHQLPSSRIELPRLHVKGLRSNHPYVLYIDCYPQEGENSYYYELYLTDEKGARISLDEFRRREDITEKWLDLYLPYPEGYGMDSDAQYIVRHYDESGSSDEYTGESTGNFVLEKTEYGLRLKVKSLSPFEVNWNGEGDGEDGGDVIVQIGTHEMAFFFDEEQPNLLVQACLNRACEDCRAMNVSNHFAFAEVIYGAQMAAGEAAKLDVSDNWVGNAPKLFYRRADKPQHADNYATETPQEPGKYEIALLMEMEEGVLLFENGLVFEIIDVGAAKLPATGDASMLGAWVALLGAAGAGLKLRRKK